MIFWQYLGSTTSRRLLARNWKSHLVEHSKARIGLLAVTSLTNYEDNGAMMMMMMITMEIMVMIMTILMMMMMIEMKIENA